MWKLLIFNGLWNALRVLAGEAEEDGQEGADTHHERIVEVGDDGY